MRWIPLLCILLVLAACSTGSTVRTYEEGENPLGEREQSVSTSARLYDDPYEKMLDEARTLMREGDYAKALPRLERLADTAEAEPEVRREALFLLGQGQGAVLNPRKDFRAGIETLQRFLDLYPESERAGDARRLIDDYSRLLLQYQEEEG